MKSLVLNGKGVYSVVFVVVPLIFNIAQTQDWKHYPYHQDGSFIYFPEDEGRHPDCEVEWWYTTAHLTGTNTGTSYAIMLTYFCMTGNPGFRILNIANESAGEFFPNTSLYFNATIAEDHLSIECTTPYGQEKWVTKTESDTLVPFQYHLEATSPNGSINLDYDTMKRPLMVGGDGFLPQGNSSETYYYAQTLLSVIGTLILNGTSEPVTGTAWLDRQYFPSYGGESYEWFSFQLSNSMDFNVWNIFTNDNQIPEDERFRMVSGYINNDSQMVSYDFGLKRTRFWNAGDGIYYSHGWEFNMEDVQLTIVPSLDDQEVSLPFRFYEGSCKIKGTVDGDSVTGVAFAELTHHYQIHQVEIICPVNGDTLSDSIQVVSWSLLNPDDGNPLFYSLSYSLNDSSIFVPVVSGIEDTFYIWDISGLPVSDNYRLQLIGYSVDSTLVGVDTTKFSISGISENITPISNRFKLYRNYPNPFGSMTMISYQLPLRGLRTSASFSTRASRPELEAEGRSRGSVESRAQSSREGFNLSSTDGRGEPVKSEFSLKIYDLTGRLIKTLVSDEIETGYYTVRWDGIDSSGKKVASGVYFYRLQVGNYTATKKMCLVR